MIGTTKTGFAHTLCPFVTAWVFVATARTQAAEGIREFHAELSKDAQELRSKYSRVRVRAKAIYHVGDAPRQLDLLIWDRKRKWVLDGPLPEHEPSQYYYAMVSDSQNFFAVSATTDEHGHRQVIPSNKEDVHSFWGIAYPGIAAFTATYDPILSARDHVDFAPDSNYWPDVVRNAIERAAATVASSSASGVPEALVSGQRTHGNGAVIFLRARFQKLGRWVPVEVVSGNAAFRIEHRTEISYRSAPDGTPLLRTVSHRVQGPRHDDPKRLFHDTLVEAKDIEVEFLDSPPDDKEFSPEGMGVKYVPATSDGLPLWVWLALAAGLLFAAGTYLRRRSRVAV